MLGVLPRKGTDMRRVERLEDMSVRGRLRLLQQEDGDIIVAVQSEKNGMLQIGDAVEFCTTGMGGGKSPRTLAALRALMVAMEEDNKAEPMRSPNAK